MNQSLRRSFVPVAVLLTLASEGAAQNSESLDQSVSTSGSSFSSVLSSARYDFGRGLSFTSRDGEATMNISGQLQAGYSWSDVDARYNPAGDPVGAATLNNLFGAGDPNGTSTSDWSIDQSRLRIGGQVIDGLTYFIQFDPQGGDEGNADLIDAWVGWQFNDAVHVRIGQQKMRSGLSADTSASDTDFETASRSLATSEFAGRRATGVLVTGLGMDGRFHWHAGAMNNGTDSRATSDLLAGITAGRPQSNDATDMAFTVGASFGSGGNSEDWSEGDLARVGEPSWITGLTVTQNNAADADYETVNVYGGFKSGDGFAAQLEFWSREGDAVPTNLAPAFSAIVPLDYSDTGFYVQTSYTLKKTGLWQPGFVVRFSSLERGFDDKSGTFSLDDLELTETLIGMNAYHAAHNLKTQLQIRQISWDDQDLDVTSIDLLFTLVF
ncbi:OprO/OprP family phosphate-selective porin [bacterium]|nr:OprO/OprP family phosphate-selective porin [bacterium]